VSEKEVIYGVLTEIEREKGCQGLRRRKKKREKNQHKQIMQTTSIKSEMERIGEHHHRPIYLSKNALALSHLNEENLKTFTNIYLCVFSLAVQWEGPLYRVHTISI